MQNAIAGYRSLTRREEWTLATSAHWEAKCRLRYSDINSV